ncbi:hypothetical protein ACWEO4_15580 [Streptomyces sp. NPDC004393]
MPQGIGRQIAGDRSAVGAQLIGEYVQDGGCLTWPWNRALSAHAS